jgi:transcriptional regulator with XRE-family HTH domain
MIDVDIARMIHAESILTKSNISTDTSMNASLSAISKAFWMEHKLVMNNFASRLKQLRAQRNISQTDLAGMVGVHYNHIGRYERGQSKPTAKTLTRLAEVLGVSTDFLMKDNSSEAAKATFQDRELLMQFKEVEKLGEIDKHLVKEFLNAFLTKKRLETMLGHSAA